jgi:hypothetical protein
MKASARAVAAVTIAVGVAAACFAQEKSAPTKKTPGLVRANTALDRELEEARREHVKRQLAAYKAYRDTLGKEKQQALDRKSLEQAVALDEAIKAATKEIDSLTASLTRPERPAPAQLEVSGKWFEPQKLKNGEKAFNNRDYVWRDVPSDLDGWTFTQNAGKGNPVVKVTAKTAGLVLIAVDPQSEVPEGWRSLGNAGFSYSDPNKSRVIVLAKDVAAGEEVKIPARPANGFVSPIVLIPPAPAQHKPGKP